MEKEEKKNLLPTAALIEKHNRALIGMMEVARKSIEMYFPDGTFPCDPDLRLELCRLAKMLVPDIRQKLDEYIYAADAADGVSVNEKQNGADLFVAGTNQRWELKTATLTKDNSVNWNWNVTAGTTDEDRTPLVDSVHRKTQNGGAVFEIKQRGTGRQIRVYRLRNAFLVGYFERIRLPKREGRNHNLGGELCQKCGEVHRMQKFLYYSDLMHKNGTLSAADWKKVFTNGYIVPTSPCFVLKK